MNLKDFERSRTKYRCCNKILYGVHGVLRVFSWNRANQVLKRYINKVKHYTPLNRGKVVTDMKHIETEPLNMIGMNIPSIYGGILSDKYWESRHEDKFFDRKALSGCQRIAAVKGWD
jgi:Diacylglycerol kinase accessory domain